MTFPQNDVELYLEAQILSGVNPQEALADLMIKYNPKFVKLWNEIKNRYGNTLYDFYHFKLNPGFNQLGLSDTFLRKWFIYPSGRTFTSMYFANTVDLSDKRVIVTDPTIITKLIGANLGSIPCLAIADGPFYIPVLKYQRSGKDRKSTRLNSSHIPLSRMPSSA